MRPTLVVKASPFNAMTGHGGQPSPRPHPYQYQSANRDAMRHGNAAPDRGRPSVVSAYPMYPGLQMPAVDRARAAGSFPRPPTKLSGAANPPGLPSAAWPPHNSISGTPQQTPPPDFVPSGGNPRADASRGALFGASGWRIRRPQHPRHTQQPPPIKNLRARPLPDQLFATLPGEVLEVVLAMLKELHLERGSDSCTTCWTRDLCSLSLASRKWYNAARRALYEHVVLVGPDSPAHKKRFKLAQGSRILLLRRTLRVNPSLADLVRSLKLPLPDTGRAAPGARLLEQYEDAVAALVMACPRLERLSGPVFTFNHDFKKLAHALSTRCNLRDMIWCMAPSATAVPPAPAQSRPGPEAPARCGPAATQTALPLDSEAAFVEHHRRWSKLTSLAIHCLPGASLGAGTLIAGALALLPSLRHLHLSGLPADAFSDANLLTLPRLGTLTLSNIAGITSAGLSSFATLANSRHLEKLTLRHTPLTSLPALARILSHMTSLVSFALVQSFPPLMPETDSFALWMMPYLASPGLKRLHWDITSHRDCANAADDILARSIAAGGFPSLESLRAPCDPNGIFQALCRPLDRADLPGDRFRSTSHANYSSSLPGTPTSPVGRLVKSPTASSMSGMMSCYSSCTDLRDARLDAQSRIDAARGDDASFRFRLTVRDEHGSLVDDFGLGSYVGTVGSKIQLHLVPDPGSSDDRGGLCDVADLISTDDAAESLAGGRRGCDGSWNRREGAAVADRREREPWWHTERGRWTPLRLD